MYLSVHYGVVWEYYLKDPISMDERPSNSGQRNQDCRFCF
jgi:hypothetical protein